MCGDEEGVEGVRVKKEMQDPSKKLLEPRKSQKIHFRAQTNKARALQEIFKTQTKMRACTPSRKVLIL